VEPRNFSANRKFSPVRNDSNLSGNHIGITAKTYNILNKRQIESVKEYRVEDFQYLIGTVHIDPDNQLRYKTSRSGSLSIAIEGAIIKRLLWSTNGIDVAVQDEVVCCTV
jgi:hypothetical protein